jgi:phage terminase large subunit-like protein
LPEIACKSTKRILDVTSGSFYRAISAEAYTNQGLNAHAVIFDELHAQKTRDLWDTLRYATAARREPLLISVTTAGYDRESICYEQHDYAKNVLAGRMVDSSFFGYIRAAAPDADWTSPEVWRRANPSFGVTLDADQFAEDCQEARQSPRKENAFRRYRLNQWVTHADSWLTTALWERGAQPFDPQALEGRFCFVGVDLARRRDIASVVLLFPHPGGYYVLPRFFLPKDNLQDRELQDRVSYGVWADQGYIILTDGEVIDYRFIRQQILQDAERYRIIQVGYDPWNAELLCNQQLGQEDGLPVMEVRQTIPFLGQATAEFERLLQAGQLQHGGNPILTWMAGNCVVRTDANNNIMPSKKHSASRIDGIMATIIALCLAMAGTSNGELKEASAGIYVG